MWKGIGSFFGRLFGSPGTADKAFDMVKNGVDSLILTKEEKVEYSIKGVELYLEYLKITFDGGHLARRVISILVTLTWMVFAGFSLYWKDMSILSTVSEPFTYVMIFYFGAGIINKVSANLGENNKV